MEILLLLTSVFGLTGGVHTFNRALIKATDDLASDFGLEVIVFSLLDGEVPFQAAADYMSSGHTRYRGFKGKRNGVCGGNSSGGLASKPRCVRTRKFQFIGLRNAEAYQIAGSSWNRCLETIARSPEVGYFADERDPLR
jgi:hypothetical protein